jgi:uncharacterized protein YbaP (TraB family)
MKKYWPTTAVIILIILTQTVTVHAKNCLWKASSEQGTFYLQGSVHLLKAADYPLDPVLINVYNESETLIFETDMVQMLSQSTQQRLLHQALLPSGVTLEDKIEPQVYAQLARELKKADIPLSIAQQFKPWYVHIMLMGPRMKAMGLDPSLGLDQYFYRKAAEDQKIMQGLETVDFQIKLFNALSEGNETAYTQYFLKDLEQTEALLSEIIQAWKTGDINALDTMLQDLLKEYPEMYTRFITDRNQAWAKKLEGMSDPDKTALVVVGVAHLAGEQGLPALLKAKGYTIEQL